jgi:hypothetical protein
MTLPEFITYKNYIDVQSGFDLAIHKDQEVESK